MRKKSNKTLKDQAWDAFSLYIRQRDRGICFTCGARNWNEELGEWSIKGMNAGHFRHSVLDFDEDNIHCQCVRCNKWQHGKLDVYGIKLMELLGTKRFKALNARADKAIKGEYHPSEWYEKKIIEYKEKLSTVLSTER